MRRQDSAICLLGQGRAGGRGRPDVGGRVARLQGGTQGAASPATRSGACGRRTASAIRGWTPSCARGLAELDWDVDPSDDLRPGAAVIARRVLAALHSAAIVILYDGGGNRSQTVVALPAVIGGIRAASYQIVPACAGDQTCDTLRSSPGPVRGRQSPE